MKRLLLTSLLILGFTYIAEARLVENTKKDTRQIKVAVIDTGLSAELYDRNEYCKTGHRDFTAKMQDIPNKPTLAQLNEIIKKFEWNQNHPVDTNGHGTHISGLIDQYAKNFIFFKDGNLPKDIDSKTANYCQIIIKYYEDDASGEENLANTIKSLRWAIDQKVDIINYSGGGILRSTEEEKLVKEALDKGIKFVAAAGNEGVNIDFFHFYPAMYDKRIIVVGALVKTQSQDRLPASNFGKSVNDWELGSNIISRMINGQYGHMSGTSQATAIKSGKLVREMLSAK